MASTDFSFDPEDLVGGFFGQQDLPDFEQVSGSELLGRAQGLLPQIGSFNQAVAQQQLGLVPFENQIRAARFGQAINPLQEAYTANILANLNLGSALPDDLRGEVIRGALEGSAASGFGLAPGGRALVARDLGISGTNLARSRREEALGALRAFPGERVQGTLSPTTAIDLERQSIDIANQRRSQEAALRSANRSAVYESLSKYAGIIVGEAFGVRGAGQGFSSVLQGLGGAAGSAGGSGAIGAGASGYGGSLPDVTAAGSGGF